MRIRSRVPRAGKRRSRSVTRRAAFQLCTGLLSAPSQSSRRATRYGTWPLVDQPPLLLLNSEKMLRPSWLRTTPAVSRTAWLVVAGSSSVTAPLAV